MGSVIKVSHKIFRKKGITLNHMLFKDLRYNYLKQTMVLNREVGLLKNLMLFNRQMKIFRARLIKVIVKWMRKRRLMLTKKEKEK